MTGAGTGAGRTGRGTGRGSDDRMVENTEGLFDPAQAAVGTVPVLVVGTDGFSAGWTLMGAATKVALCGSWKQTQLPQETHKLR